MATTSVRDLRATESPRLALGMVQVLGQTHATHPTGEAPTLAVGIVRFSRYIHEPHEPNRLAVKIVCPVRCAVVHLPPYKLAEFQFAYCYRVYLRWHTHRLRQLAPLRSLTLPAMQELAGRFDIQVLECNASDTEALVLVSLQPAETVSACASKLKGQLSKWLRTSLALEQPESLLGNGYFACTSGQSTQDAVNAYLDKQSAHHGYAERVLKPVHVEEFTLTDAAERDLNPSHACALLKFHVVLASQRRVGVFGAKSGKAIAAAWRELETECEQKFALLKVSFVPDHVHLAVQQHPATSPAAVVVELMNAAQETMRGSFPEDLIQAGVSRLWQPSAYIGSFGEIKSRQVAAYVRRWREQAGSGG